MARTPDPALHRLVGAWTTEATHPSAPGVVVRGTVTIEWLEGETFLIHRARTDHRDFPDSISIIGNTERDRVDLAEPDPAQSTMHYFDSRGVFRVYEVRIDEACWKIWREAPGMSQRFTGTVTDGGDTIEGLWQMCQDGALWQDDLRITYRRAASAP